MELHVIEREGRKTVVLLDNEMRIVKPVYDYLKFQRQKDKALNTLKASGSDLRTYWEFLNDNGYEYDKVTPNSLSHHQSPPDIVQFTYHSTDKGNENH